MEKEYIVRLSRKDVYEYMVKAKNKAEAGGKVIYGKAGSGELVKPDDFKIVEIREVKHD